jgi:hypothetical protein
MASGRTAQHRALVAIEQTLRARRHGVWVCTRRAEGTRLVHVAEAVDGASRYKRYQIDGRRHRHDTQRTYGGLS